LVRFYATFILQTRPKEISVKLGFTYNQSEDDGATKYLELLRSKINVKN